MRMPPPTVNGTNTWWATARTVSRSILRFSRAGLDVVEDDLVDLVLVELLGEVGGGRDVDVVLELLGLGDAAVDHVEAGDEALGQHVSVPGGRTARGARGRRGPLFSAWNCVATMLSRATIEQNSTPYSVTPSASAGVGGRRVERVDEVAVGVVAEPVGDGVGAGRRAPRSSRSGGPAAVSGKRRTRPGPSRGSRRRPLRSARTAPGARCRCRGTACGRRAPARRAAPTSPDSAERVDGGPRRAHAGEDDPVARRRAASAVATRRWAIPRRSSA